MAEEERFELSEQVSPFVQLANPWFQKYISINSYKKIHLL